jgi:2Fe-2S ferredoxin
MTPRSFPGNPVFADPSERLVWEELMATLPSEASVVCGLRILEHEQEYELDFTVLWPNVGISVLEVAHSNNINLEGACEGSLACSTCHVVVDKNFYDRLSPPSEDEEDMLDLAFGLTPTSRLGCQIIMTKELDGLTLIVPDETRNISINN